MQTICVLVWDWTLQATPPTVTMLLDHVEHGGAVMKAHAPEVTFHAQRSSKRPQLLASAQAQPPPPQVVETGHVTDGLEDDVSKPDPVMVINEPGAAVDGATAETVGVAAMM